MKIYIAAKYGKRRDQEVIDFVAKLEDEGHEITARWLRGDGEKGMTVREAAVMDMEDVVRADTLIFIGQPQGSENRGGGRWFEFGAAWALGKRLIAVIDHDESFRGKDGDYDRMPHGHESVFTELPEVELIGSLEGFFLLDPTKARPAFSRGVKSPLEN